MVTGQRADTPTSGLDDSRTRQLADATGDFSCLVFVLLAASARPRVVQSATCPVRELPSYHPIHPKSLLVLRFSFSTNSLERLKLESLLKRSEAVESEHVSVGKNPVVG